MRSKSPTPGVAVLSIMARYAGSRVDHHHGALPSRWSELSESENNITHVLEGTVISADLTPRQLVMFLLLN
jgi:hypothetical protein